MRTGRKKRIVPLLVLLFLMALTLLSVPVKADGDIVFAAQRYERPAKHYRDEYGPSEEKLVDAGPYHLYTIHADGTGMKRLTLGKEHSLLPRFSPDGKRIAFIRRAKDWRWGSDRVCLIARTGGKITTLLRLPAPFSAHRLQWSPDGRFLAVSLDTEMRDTPKLSLIRLSDRTSRQIGGVESCAWSPEGHWLYLCHHKRRASLLDVRTMRARRIKTPVSNPCWLADQTILGETGFDKDTARWPGRYLSIVTRQGRTLHEVGFEAPVNGMDLEHECVFYLPARNSSTLLLQTAEGISDGIHWYCYTVDIKTGRSHPLRDGRLIGISPHGDAVAVADHQWIGPYKEFRGGRRVGPLEIVSLKTRKVRKITRGILSIYGGDWWHPPTLRKPRNPALAKRPVRI
jgi:WD40 repeat protein